MAAAWAIAGSTAINVGMSIWGGNKAADAAEAQAEAQNRAMRAKFEYDIKMWNMKRNQLKAQREEAVVGILTSARNEGKVRAYKDAAAEEQHLYNLRIRDSQTMGNALAFQRSEDIYTSTTSLNSLAARASADAEIVKLQEKQDEFAYDRNEAYLESLIAEGKLRATGASGRSASKAVQSTLADYGRQMEMLSASGDSMTKNTRRVLQDIMRDKTSADLTAFASKMLEPGEIPEPIKAAPIPEPDYDLPRQLQEYDFGPQPVMGAMADPGAAAQAVWGNTITSIGSAIGSGINSAVVANN